MYKLLPILLFAYGLAITADDIYDNSYALIIGIDKYQNVQHLDYAVKDAESIQDILVNTFDFPEGNITLLKNEEANKDAILEAFSDITTIAEDEDRVLIYFAGHGDTKDLADGGEMGYLLPVDADMYNLYSTSISINLIQDISEQSESKHMLFLLDACLGGMPIIRKHLQDYTGKTKKTKAFPQYIQKITRDKSRLIITAGGRDDMVIERSEWGHSAFTMNLIRALKEGNADFNDDGFITGDELGLYLKEKVSIDSEFMQTPRALWLTSDEGDFVFIKNPKEQETLVLKEVTTDELKEQETLYLKEVTTDKLKEILNTQLSYKELNEIAHELATRIPKVSENTNNNPIVDIENIYNNSWAVIIGINDYTKSKPLKYAVNDALAINEMLINKFGFENNNIKLLTNKEATYFEIRKTLFDIAKLAEENDRILVYFAGHGQTVSTEIDKMEIGYIIPVDGDINNPIQDGIPMDDIIRMGKLSKSKHMLFLMDACYSGLMAEATRGLDKDIKEQGYLSAVSNITARQIITAGGAKQEVVEIDELQHSAFAFNLLNALDKWEAGSSEKAYITASMLGEYLRTTVSNDTRGKQTPEVARFRYSKNGEFVFTLKP